MNSPLRLGALAVATSFAATAAFAQSAAHAPAPAPATSQAPAPAPSATPAPAPEPAKSGAAAPSQTPPGAGKASAGGAAARSGGMPGGLKMPSSTEGKTGAAGSRPQDGRPRKDPSKRVNLQSVYAEVMTDAEKTAFRDKVRKVKTYDECKTLMEATHQTMEPRAKSQGKALSQTPTEACDKAKERGRVTG